MATLQESNYASLAKRIRKATDKQRIEAINKSADRIHQLGLLTNNELARLDTLAMNKLIDLGHPNRTE